MAPKIKYKSIIKKLKEVSKIDIETIYMSVTNKEDCPDCETHPITGEVLNAFCPVCGGTGVIEESDSISIEANVDHKGLASEATIRGIVYDGRVSVTIIVDELMRNDLDPEEFLTERYPVDYIYINSTKYEIDRVTPGKLQGILYELILELVPMQVQ